MTAPGQTLAARGPASDDSLAHLMGRLDLVSARVRATVAARRAEDPDPDDAFRGLYISEAHVAQLLAAPRRSLHPEMPDSAAREAAGAIEAAADSAEAASRPVRLRQLARAFALDAYDVELLLIALAPDLDPRFERLYGYLHDDISRRRASAGLALELCGTPFGTAEARARLSPESPLVSGGLLLVEDAERPFLTRALRVPDRVTGHLLGDDTPDPPLASILEEPGLAKLPDDGLLARALPRGIGLVYVRERTGTAGRLFAANGLDQAGFTPIVLDLSRLSGGDDVASLAAAATREARLRHGGLVCGPVEVLAERGSGAVRAFAEAPCPVVVVGTRSWDPLWSKRVPLLVDAHHPSRIERADLWRQALAAEHTAGSDGIHAALDPAEAIIQFRLSPEQVFRAARAARQQAEAVGRPVSAVDLQAGARAQNAAGLDRLARRIEPRARPADLVLPTDVQTQLAELAARPRHRDRVLDEWGVGGSASKGRGITALFAGDSGTGKTLSAEVVAGQLGLDLYVIDLSTVIDKYIGETEKNLDRIFSEADRVNGVLLFDEADAIFGKRSEVKDARDRYANVEVAYLLQRMELFDGLAILTTNLRANVDEAFTRRLDAIVDFPMPEEDLRLRLWERHLPPALPQAADIDLRFVASRFRLSGGNIRNICVAAAFYAAAGDRQLDMADLIRATAREYRKMGRLTVEAEFGPYVRLLAATL